MAPTFFCEENDLSLLFHAMISLVSSRQSARRERLGQQQSGVMYILFEEPLLLGIFGWMSAKKSNPARLVVVGSIRGVS